MSNFGAKFLKNIFTDAKRLNIRRPSTSKASRHSSVFAGRSSTPAIVVSSLNQTSHMLTNLPSTSTDKTELNVVLKHKIQLLDIVENIYDKIFELDPETRSTQLGAGPANADVGDLSELVQWLNADRPANAPKRVLRISPAALDSTSRWLTGSTDDRYTIDDSLFDCLMKIFTNANSPASYSLTVSRVAPPSQFELVNNGYCLRNYRTAEVLYITYRADTDADDNDNVGTLHIQRYTPAFI